MSEFTPIFCCCDDDGGGGGQPNVCCACPTSSYLVSWTGHAVYMPTTDCGCLGQAAGGGQYGASANAIVNPMEFTPFSGVILIGGACSGAQARQVSGPRRWYDWTDPNDTSFCEPSFGGTATLNSLISIHPPRGTSPNCPGGVQPYWEARVSVPGEGGSVTMIFRKNGYDCAPGQLQLHSVSGSTSGSCAQVQVYHVGSYSISPGQLFIT